MTITTWACLDTRRDDPDGDGVRWPRRPPRPRAQRDLDPAVVRTGAGLFRERCAECHGADAKGVAGHDLTRLWASGATDERVFQTIRAGVPNTLMPSSAAPDDELRALVAYLRSLNGSAAAGETARGNTDNGERIFWASCGSCHAVKGRGGVLGPDFSRVAQTSREALTQAIRESERVDGRRLPGDHAGHARRTARARHAQERRRAVDSDHGYERAPARIPQVQPAGGHQGAGSLMPAFGPDQTDRRRSQRCAGVLEHASPAGWRTRTRRGRTRRRSRTCGRPGPF